MPGVRHTIAVLLLPALAACATLRVQSDFERDVDFDAYRAFAFLPLNAPPASSPSLDPLDNEIVSRRIQREIQRTLEQRGYRLTTPEEADFWVAFQVASEEKVELRSYPYSVGFIGGHGFHGFRGYPFLGAGLGTGTYSRTYIEGALVVHFVDAAANELVWHGRATERLPSRKPAVDRIEESVVAILDQFPPVLPVGTERDGS